MRTVSVLNFGSITLKGTLLFVINFFHPAFSQPNFFPVESGTELLFGRYESRGRFGPSIESFDTVSIKFDSVNIQPGKTVYRKRSELVGLTITGSYGIERPYSNTYGPIKAERTDTLPLLFGNRTVSRKIGVNGVETDAILVTHYTGDTSLIFVPWGSQNAQLRNLSWIATVADGYGLVQLHHSPLSGPEFTDYILKKRNGVALTLTNLPMELHATDYVELPPVIDTARPEYFPVREGDECTFSKYGRLGGDPFLEFIESVRIRFDSVMKSETGVIFLKTVKRTGFRIHTKREGQVIVSKDTLLIGPEDFSMWDTVSFWFGSKARFGSLTVSGNNETWIFGSAGIHPLGTVFYPDNSSSRTRSAFNWEAYHLAGIGLLQAEFKPVSSGGEFNFMLRSVNGKDIQVPNPPTQLRFTSIFPEVHKIVALEKSKAGRKDRTQSPLWKLGGFDWLGRWLR